MPDRTGVPAAANIEQCVDEIDDFIETLVRYPESVIAMGKNLSLTVVAQGVENRAQAEFLRDHACDELQGFYLNRPMPPEEFAKLLLANEAESSIELESKSA